MADRIEDLLTDAAGKEGEKFKSITVEKALDCEFDLGELLVVDPNAIEEQKLKQDTEQYLSDLTRDNVQLFFNKLFQIPTEVREDTVVMALPDPITRLPREKPCPKPKAPTKWEEYRMKKGLRPAKKEKMVWDEESKSFKPRFGYNRINAEKDVWAIPVPEGADPMEDQFKKLRDDKKEKVAKNEFQRLRNIQRANKISKLAVSAVMPTEKITPALASKAAAVAKGSTASMGKFDRKLALEKEAKIKGKKRKFEDNIGSLGDEKKRALKILGEMDHTKPKLNYARVVEKQMKRDVQAEIKQKKERKRGTRSSKNLGNKKAAIKMAKVNRLKGKTKGNKGNKRR